MRRAPITQVSSAFFGVVRCKSIPSASRVSSQREELVKQLSEDVFGRGNVHLKNVETLTSLPEGLFSFPEVSFIGKPNVGKSTLISALLRNPRLAKGGVVPGSTRLLQFFNVGDGLLLVDTPGYGGWRQRKTDDKLATRANAFSILFRYLSLRKESNLKHVYWLMESSPKGPISLGPRDEEILAFLMRENIKFTVVLSKLDRHVRYYERQRDLLLNPATIRTSPRDGTPILPPRRMSGSCPTPQEGIRRNMEEIMDFLGTDRVPIIGACADRKIPENSYNIESIQHDIVYHCCEGLKDEDLSFEKLHEISYAPPSAEAIQQVQLKYPIEAFVVPEDNYLSLEEMVRRHEVAKRKEVQRLYDRGEISAADIQTLHLVDCEALESERELEEDLRRSVASLPPQAVVTRFLEEGNTSKNSPNADDTVYPSPQGKKKLNFSRRPTLRSPQYEMDWRGAFGEREGLVEVDHTSDCVSAAPHAVEDITEMNREEEEREENHFYAVSLPPSLDPQCHYVTAINGVRIPRSMLTHSIQQLAVSKEDELASFALRSGAGAYEEILAEDQESDVPHHFIQFQDTARLSEGQLDHMEQRQINKRKSKKTLRREHVNNKYVEGVRGERSIHMQAEGFMCPWLAGAGQPHRQVVKGNESQSSPSGSVMKGLKRRGFGGGRSYSLRTMKDRGRATKKTGKWAT